MTTLSKLKDTELKKKIGDTFMVIIHGEDEVFTDKDNEIINKLVLYTLGFIHSAVEEAKKEDHKQILKWAEDKAGDCAKNDFIYRYIKKLK